MNRTALPALFTLPFVLLAVSVTASVRAENLVVRGRLIDAVASMEAFRRAEGKDKENWQRPLAGQSFKLELLPEGRNWSPRTDEEGKFAVDTGLTSLPRDGRFIITTDLGEKKLYSTGLVSAEDEINIYLCPTTGDPGIVNCRFGVVYDIIGPPDARRFRVRISVAFENTSNHLYVGKRSGSPWREVFRVRVPADAEVVENKGPVTWLDWKRTADGKWLVIDEPVPGILEQAFEVHGSRQWRWSATYLTWPSQEMAATYHFPMRCDRLVLYGGQDEVKLLPTPELGSPFPIPKDPMTQEERKYEAYGLSQSLSHLEPGHRLVLGISVSSASIGQISHRALKWHGGFLIISLVAILLGLLVGPRRAPAEAALAGLGHEEMLDRISALDKRFEEGKIRSKEYHRYRAAMVGIVAEELEAGTAAKAMGPAPEARGVPEAVLQLVKRIRDLDKQGATLPEVIQERAHLLEALYKAIAEESPK